MIDSETKQVKIGPNTIASMGHDNLDFILPAAYASHSSGKATTEHIVTTRHDRVEKRQWDDENKHWTDSKLDDMSVKDLTEVFQSRGDAAAALAANVSDFELLGRLVEDRFRADLGRKDGHCVWYRRTPGAKNVQCVTPSCRRAPLLFVAAAGSVLLTHTHTHGRSLAHIHSALGTARRPSRLWAYPSR